MLQIRSTAPIIGASNNPENKCLDGKYSHKKDFSVEKRPNCQLLKTSKFRFFQFSWKKLCGQKWKRKYAFGKKISALTFFLRGLRNLVSEFNFGFTFLGACNVPLFTFLTNLRVLSHDWNTNWLCFKVLINIFCVTPLWIVLVWMNLIWNISTKFDL